MAIHAQVSAGFPLYSASDATSSYKYYSSCSADGVNVYFTPFNSDTIGIYSEGRVSTVDISAAFDVPNYDYKFWGCVVTDETTKVVFTGGSDSRYGLLKINLPPSPPSP